MIGIKTSENKESLLTTKVQIYYGLGVSYAIVDQIFAQWILYFYLPPESSGLKPIIAPLLLSVALGISRIVDMVTDPLMGYISDRTDSKWGRRIPYIALGSLPLSLCTIGFFYPPIASSTQTFLYLTVIGSLFFTFYTVVSAPYNALIPEIGRDRTERLNLSTWQSVFRLIFSAIAMIFPGILIEYFGKGDTLIGIRGMIISLSILSAIGGYMTVFGVREKDYSIPVEKKVEFKSSVKFLMKDKAMKAYLGGLLFFFIGFNELRAIMNYYIEDIMGYGKAEITLTSALLFGVAALCFYPTNVLSRKYGYRKIMLWSMYLMIIFTIALYFLGRGLPSNYGFTLFALVGIPISGAAFIFPPAMLSEIVSRLNQESGVRIEGICFGVQGFFLKMAFFISIAILPVLLVTGEGETVTKLGIYRTTLFSLVSFIIALYFYHNYED